MSSSNYMGPTLESIQKTIDRRIGIYESKKISKKTSKRKLRDLEDRQTNCLQAIKVVQEVARLTQEELEFKICQIVTSAIQAIFKEPHELEISFEMKRNKTEAEIYVIDENGNELNLMNDDGGGLLDIVTFSLRLACWRIKSNKTRPLFIFDEPWKNLSKKYRPGAMQFMKDISDKLGIQIVMITHIEEFIDGADNVIEIK